MNIKPIKTKKDYEQAMLQLENLFDAKKGAAKGDELEILTLLIEKYEDENFPIDLPDPVEAIKFRYLFFPFMRAFCSYRFAAINLYFCRYFYK